MRVPVAAGNWKCNTRRESATALASGLREALRGVDGVEKVVCPPFLYLASVAEALAGSSIKLGSQDVHWADDEAATGEIGPQMLAELVQYAIIGHSERRHRFGETDEMVNRKVKAALAVGLRPIMCVGETLEEREAGKTKSSARTLGPKRGFQCRAAASSNDNAAVFRLRAPCERSLCEITYEPSAFLYIM